MYQGQPDMQESQETLLIYCYDDDDFSCVTKKPVWVFFIHWEAARE